VKVTRQPRGPYAKSAATREAILDAALASFVRFGYDATSLREIAERAGLTHAGVLHHFSSKQALLVALLARRDAQENQRAGLDDDHPAAASPPPGRDLLSDLLREHQQTPELMRLWAELAPAAARADHPAHNYFVERYRRVREVFAEQLAAGAVGGPLDDRLDPDTAAVLFAAVLDGLQTQWLLDQSVDIIAALGAFRTLLTAPPGRR
jgi:AcrR family transcriptional regulator